MEGPIGRERDDALAAMISFYVLRAAGAKSVKYVDLLPQWGEPKNTKQTGAQMAAIASAYNRALGGKVGKRGTT
jgi:hypothetical protein